MAITLNFNPEIFFPSCLNHSFAISEACMRSFVLDSYINKGIPVLKAPTPPVLSTIFTPPHAAPESAGTCSSPSALTSTWLGSDFTYNATVSGQMTIPNIDKVIAALSNPKSAGFIKIYEGVMADKTTRNSDGSYTYFILNSTLLSDTYIGQTVKFNVTRDKNNVTITREITGTQPAAPNFMSWGPLTFYTNYSVGKVTWTFTQIEDSQTYNVTCQVNSKSNFFNQIALDWMKGNPLKAQKQFDTNLTANFSAARALFTTP